MKLQHTGFTLVEDTIAHAEGWNQCLKNIQQLINAKRHASANI
ncbi:MAG: hypothetical protein JST58_20315 [Bacteroidetes bacterium]|nr:hypothetical protein [Bacteroidota bacterium]